MIARTVAFLLVAVLLSVAGWQLGQAGLIAGKAWAAPVLIKWSWDHRDADEMPEKPWPWADSYPIARLEVAGEDITRFVLAGDNMRNLAFGPVLSEVAASQILFGHRDTHFRFLKNLTPGQSLSFQKAGGPARNWRVQQADIVAADALSVPAAAADPALLLVTCYPFDAMETETDQRYVVWLVPDDQRAL
ncbi:sortase [Sneathiella marina]|uniref:Sortase n=1 Tax=Sneathiella marina TaxID=2950108 RepID=A0ABY4W568_9PROT|nr:sortase [Sneathiella marina]USG60439.1 sortase [Sneathiella marina]